ncbi:MAG TPA: twin-arginine translocation signal domain-containing protein, partial [Roseiflexaceae bacterium]|nr:twin-arginine translocation signal domain-containing protein [Roseiflexaceae bacterium]
MSLSRRGFMVGCSSAIAAMAGGRVSNLVFGAEDASRDILVTVFLRGGCDALSLVAPAGDSDYQSSRKTLLVKQGNPATDPAAGWQLANTLDPAADFRFHNQARPLHELYGSGNLAVIHACGLTNGTRSHFDAMDYIERGTPADKGTPSGWIARHLQSIGLLNDSP